MAEGAPSYFKVYGGWRAIFRSYFFYAGVSAAVLGWSFFSKANWWDTVISVVPGMVGFSIAAVAIFFSLSGSELRKILAGEDAGESSAFMDFMAMFTHFIVVQVIALSLALLSKFAYAVPSPPAKCCQEIVEILRAPFWLAGGIVFCYGIALCFAVAVEVYRIARIVDAYQTACNKQAEQEQIDDRERATAEDEKRSQDRSPRCLP